MRYFGTLAGFRIKSEEEAYILFDGRDKRRHRYVCDRAPMVVALLDMFGAPFDEAIKEARGKEFEYSVERGRCQSLFPITDATR